VPGAVFRLGIAPQGRRGPFCKRKWNSISVNHFVQEADNLRGQVKTCHDLDSSKIFKNIMPFPIDNLPRPAAKLPLRRIKSESLDDISDQPRPPCRHLSPQ
jgi:hypothetical protein